MPLCCCCFVITYHYRKLFEMGTKRAYRGLLLNRGFVLWADTDTPVAACSCEGTEVCIYIQYLHKEVSALSRASAR